MAATTTSATTPAAAGTAAAVAELQDQIEATVEAGASEVAVVPVAPVPIELPLVMTMPEMGGRPAAELPPVSDLLVLLLHLRGSRTSRPGSARQGRAAESRHGNSHGA